MNSVRVYFVLYIVLLCEIFIVILERDETVDRIKALSISGTGTDFSIIAPDTNLSVTIFSVSIGSNIARSDSIKTTILGHTFLNSDILEIMPEPYWISPPRNIDINAIKLSIKPAIQDSLLGNYILSVIYNGSRPLRKTQYNFSNGVVGIRCSIMRIYKPSEMHGSRTKKDGREYLVIGNETKELETIGGKSFIKLSGNTEVNVIFNVSYFEVKCDPC